MGRGAGLGRGEWLVLPWLREGRLYLYASNAISNMDLLLLISVLKRY